MVNRATKRLMAKQQAAEARQKARPRPGGDGRAAAAGLPVQKEPLFRRIVKFTGEARNELKKVAWPSRGEVMTYTLVVLISVTFITLIVFGLDFAFGKGVFNLYGR